MVIAMNPPKPREAPEIFKRFVDRLTTTEEEERLRVDVPLETYESLCRARKARDHAHWIVETETRTPDVAAQLRAPLDPNASPTHEYGARLCEGLALLLELQLQANQLARKVR